MAEAQLSRDQVKEYLKSLSLLEAAELVKDLEKELGVSAAAPVAMAAAPASMIVKAPVSPASPRRRPLPGLTVLVPSARSVSLRWSIGAVIRTRTRSAGTGTASPSGRFRSWSWFTQKAPPPVSPLGKPKHQSPRA